MWDNVWHDTYDLAITYWCKLELRKSKVSLSLSLLLEFMCLVKDDAEGNGTGHTGDDHS